MRLSEEQRQRYERMIASGQAALRRWSPSNPMRNTVESTVAWAMTQLMEAR